MTFRVGPYKHAVRGTRSTVPKCVQNVMSFGAEQEEVKTNVVWTHFQLREPTP